MCAGIALLGACGGGGTSNSQKADTTADKAAAVRINLRQSDFPSGWNARPYNPTPQQATSVVQLAQCLGMAGVTSQATADVHSPDFDMGQTTMAASNVRFARSDADASTELAAYQSAKGPDCFKQAFEPVVQARLPSGMTTSDLAVHQLDFPTLRDGTAAYQASFTLPLGGNNVPVYSDYIVFKAGRGVVNMFTTNVGSPFDPKLEKDLAMKMVSRV